MIMDKNKSDLVYAVMQNTYFTKRDAQRAVTAVIDAIKEEARHGSLQVNGIGTFTARWIAPHKGRNPKTGEPVDVPEKLKIYFKPSKEFTALVNS